jgi:hypothetical protein
MHASKYLATAFFLLSSICTISFGQAGPPVIGDDPGTPGNGHWEINLAYPYAQTEKTIAMDFPYVDLNYGLGDHLQLKYQGGYFFGKYRGQGWQNGYDDSLVGVKWRYLDEDKSGVDMSTYPQLGINTSSSLVRNGIVESGLSFYLPVEIAKTFGPFQVAAELGYQFYEHDRDLWAGGAVVAYNLSERIQLVGEIRDNCDKSFVQNNVILDGGVRAGIVDHVTFLIAAGRGVRNGDDSPHLYFYTAIQLTF